MKTAASPLRSYEVALRQLEPARTEVKVDNRSLVVKSLGRWVEVQNPSGKIAASQVELPVNPAYERGGQT